MKRNATIMALSVALAACSGGEDISTADADADNDGAVSLEEATQIAKASGLKPQPGQYRATTNMGGFDTSIEYCITPEQAEGGFEDMMKEGQQGECSYEKFELAGNDIDALLTCSADGGQMQVEMKGTVTPTSSDLSLAMSGQMGGMSISLSGKSQHQRIGDCTEN